MKYTTSDDPGVEAFWGELVRLNEALKPKALDGVLPKPKTQYELYLRRMNNIEAQWIGESSFSRKIEVTA